MQLIKSVLWWMFVLVFYLLSSREVKAEEIVNDFIYPLGNGVLEGFHISQGFATTFEEGYCSVSPYSQSYENCTGSWMYGHDGLDISNYSCGSVVSAVGDGMIVHASESGGWGNLVRIRHLTTTGYRYTLYAHLQRIDVAVNQTVVQGQQIGLLGTTGNSGSCHLHFGVLTTDTNGSGYYYGSMPSDHLDPSVFITVGESPTSYSSPSNPVTSSAPGDLTTAKDTRQATKLRVIDTYAGYDVTQTAEYYLGVPFMSFERWFNDGTITYDDGVPSDAYIQRYGLLSNGDTNGVIVVHPDTGMAVEMWGHTFRFWERASASGYSYVDNCGVSWFASGTGPRSEFGLPITTEYYADDNNRWRRDFQRGYMAWDPTNNIMYLNCYSDSTPGWTNWNGWDGDISAAVAGAYERNGAKEVVGYAFDNGSGATVHIWGGVLIQDFMGGENGGNAVMVNLDGLDSDLEMNASVVRSGFWDYYQENDGEVYFGAPLGDEMDTGELDGYLRGYDPYCDTNANDWVNSDEREGCIEEFCGPNSTIWPQYTSMQRFEEVTLCYESTSGLVEER